MLFCEPESRICRGMPQLEEGVALTCLIN
jgi:hypothetical protein